MTANPLPAPAFTLGGFLRDRRGRLAPAPNDQGRRRTPGLRREEVATRAGVSITWYTWLEQGRGGPPSDEVLERLARALELDATGREILFLLGQQRPPPLSPSPPPAVTPALQRVLDAFPNPAIVKTSTWDIVAWNEAARTVLGDYTSVPESERNVLRRMFGYPAIRAALPHWEADARFALAVFRMDIARAGGSPEAIALAAELQATSADFRRLWAENDVATHWVGQKHFDHPVVGPFTLETSAYSVGGAAGLTMVLFTPISADDARAMGRLLAGEAAALRA